MFYENAPTVAEPGMVFFLHMILMDSDTSNCNVPRQNIVSD